MKEGVVEVGPTTVRGSCDAPASLVSTALNCLDDDIALLDDQPVAVTAMWREVFRTVLPEAVETAVLVCPTWWPSARIDRVREAAAVRSANVVVRQRAQVITEHAPGNPTVAEIAPDLVVVSRGGRVVAAEPRLGDNADNVRAVVDGIGSATAVVVDAPVGVPGAVEFAAAIAGELRSCGVAATTVHPDQMLAVSQHPPPPSTRAPEWPRRPMQRTPALAALVTVALLCVGLGAGSELNGSPTAEVPMTLLVEGRVALKVPALWTVQRITAGPGSARVQVSAPNSSAAVLVTQAQVRKGEALSTTAASLRSALDDQEVGVFSEFNPDDRRADRAAATYREIRDGRQIDWVVFVDDAVRIGIGCQSSPGEQHVVRYACEQATRSAHALF